MVDAEPRLAPRRFVGCAHTVKGIVAAEERFICPEQQGPAMLQKAAVVPAREYVAQGGMGPSMSSIQRLSTVQLGS